MPKESKRLHILYVVQYFNLPSEPGGSRAYQFARRWVEKGHSVTVLTSNLNHKTLSGKRGFSTEIVDGIRILRLPTYNRIRGSYSRRILNFLSYAALASLRGLLTSRFDVVYASSTPLTTGVAGACISLLRRRPFFFEVRDLWPDSAVVAGVLSNPRLVRFIEWFERACYRRATKIIAVTEGIRQGVIRKGKDPNDVLFVPQGVDDWMIDYVPADSPLLERFKDQFVCTYIGAHGKWNGLETLLQAAARVKNPDIHFLFVGDGDYKDALEKWSRERGLANVTFADPVPKKNVLDILAGSQLALICTWDHPFHEMVLANKFFDYLAAGAPIVAAARGEMPSLIYRAGCGWTVEPECPDQLAHLLDELSRKPLSEVQAAGRRGQRFALKHFVRSSLGDQVAALFHSQNRSYSTRTEVISHESQ